MFTLSPLRIGSDRHDIGAAARRRNGGGWEFRRLRNMFGRVRPERPDIAAPDLPSGIAWVGGRPAPMQALTASGPVLVHFFDFAQLNSVRALPYVGEWQRRYASAGLTVLGVQAPRFAFGADPDVVRMGLDRLGVAHPVAIDAEREIWLDYGCQGWPSLFLWGRGGVLRWYHFGEGEYGSTEEAIQEELRAQDALRELPPPMQPLRPSDAPGAAVIPPTPELFPGAEGAPLRLGAGNEGMRLEYEAAGAHATLEGRGTVLVTIDDRPAEEIRSRAPASTSSAAHPRNERHRLALEAGTGEVDVWSLSFSPGVP